jgi:NADH-quinone oxidoreductase subunit J
LRICFDANTEDSNYLMDLQTFLFWLIAALTGISAVLVVVTQNIVRCATWLLFSLGGAAGIFFLLGADFVGATQLLVYVGGTLVLVVFGVMLTAQGPFISMKAGAPEWATAMVVGVLLYAALAGSILFGGLPQESRSAQELNEPDKAEKSLSSVQLGQAFLGLTPKSESGRTPENVPAGRVQTRGRSGPVGYLLPFEIVSVHLLVVLIGAAYLARAKRRRAEVE